MLKSLIFDIGGTTIRAGKFLINENYFEKITRYQTPNIWASSKGEQTEQEQILFGTLSKLGAELFGEEIPNLVVVGFPGAISPAGYVYRTPTVWGDKDRGSFPLQAVCNSLWPQSRVYCVNDVTAAGYYFVARDCNDFCIVTVSSGIGCKIFLDGRPITGMNGRGGEIGHLKVDNGYKALMCDCGDRGHLGGIASGRGILALIKNRAIVENIGFKDSLLGSFCVQNVDLIENEEIVRAFHEGDQWTVNLVSEASQSLGFSLAAIHTIIGIEEFKIMGGIALALGESYRKLLVNHAQNSCWDLGQKWDHMIQLAPNSEELGLMGGGKLSVLHFEKH